MIAARWRRRPGLGMRLLIAQTTVLLAGAITTWVVAAVVGPPLFREHLHRAGVPGGSAEQLHAEEAYLYATVFSVGGAVAVSALTAFAVTLYVSRRLQRSVTEVAAAASAVSEGRYDVRVAPQNLGEDFDALSGAFNRMAAQLEAIDTTRRQLFGDLAHEIRTPVAVLEACLEAVEDGIRPLTPDTIAMMRDQSRRLVRFAGDLGALAQAEESAATMSFTDLDVADVITRTVAAVADRYHAKNVVLSTDLAAVRHDVWGDPQRLTQVLVNVLDNALRHTSAGGHVNVGTDIEGPHLVVRVTDDGDGIADAHLPHVFERLYRADTARDRDHGGSGLGLAIAKALVDAHGGHISATSAGSGTGATFTIGLPLLLVPLRTPSR
ncbi:signal transduction histidine kinase (plasmid) [Mycolicibacterium chubuense NBB4]|uniref:histidine kinase n=1 Tax=Mycolicibacterium chubuense (strain NBB4) TaxID=710421 RepID=I4BST8_MYCCN|nr:ATP-binding protein [Mycolicibacterium chubuense]AFM20345.1 signal transduction histidine kinase [Mycolicibacterium chubuense NBB4]